MARLSRATDGRVDHVRGKVTAHVDVGRWQVDGKARTRGSVVAVGHVDDSIMPFDDGAGNREPKSRMATEKLRLRDESNGSG